MYVVGEAITVTWILPATDTPLTATDYDIRIVPSTLLGTYTDAAVVNFVAPTATESGSFTYTFTPIAPGLYRLFLSTGTAASHNVISQKKFWIFGASLSFTNSLEVLGRAAYPEQALLKSDTCFFDLGWYDIDGIAQHPVDSRYLYVVGQELFADTQSSVVVLDLQTCTAGPVYKTVPELGTHGIAVDRNGRAVVIYDHAINTDQWECAYTDDLTNWTVCTRDASFDTTNKGAALITWDDYLEMFWWNTVNIIGTSKDGQTFYYTPVDTTGEGDSGDPNSLEFVRRLKLSNTDSRLIMGSTPLGGAAAGQERIYVNISDPPQTAPPIFSDTVGVSDIYGDNYNSQLILDASADLNNAVAWLMSREGLFSPSNGLTSFDHSSIVDISSIMATTTGLRYFFTIPDFGRYYAVELDANAPNGWNVYESSNMSTWALSTDPRLTTYPFATGPGAGNLRTKVTDYHDGTGFAYVSKVGTSNNGIVAVI